MESTMLIKKIDDLNSVIIDIETKEVLVDAIPHADALARFSRIKVMTHLWNATF